MGWISRRNKKNLGKPAGLCKEDTENRKIAEKAQNQLETFAITNKNWDDNKIMKNLKDSITLGNFSYTKKRR